MCFIADCGDRPERDVGKNPAAQLDELADEAISKIVLRHRFRNVGCFALADEDDAGVVAGQRQSASKAVDRLQGRHGTRDCLSNRRQIRLRRVDHNHTQSAAARRILIQERLYNLGGLFAFVPKLPIENDNIGPPGGAHGRVGRLTVLPRHHHTAHQSALGETGDKRLCIERIGRAMLGRRRHGRHRLHFGFGGDALVVVGFENLADGLRGVDIGAVVQHDDRLQEVGDNPTRELGEGLCHACFQVSWSSASPLSPVSTTSS